jgi:hypothetical protein
VRNKSEAGIAASSALGLALSRTPSPLSGHHEQPPALQGFQRNSIAYTHEESHFIHRRRYCRNAASDRSLGGGARLAAPAQPRQRQSFPSDTAPVAEESAYTILTALALLI